MFLVTLSLHTAGMQQAQQLLIGKKGGGNIGIGGGNIGIGGGNKGKSGATGIQH